MTPNIWDYREPLERALQYSGGTHTFEDVAQMVFDQRAQLWPNGRSVAVTEVITYPRKRILHCFLAGGKMSEIIEMMPHAAQWGASVGCAGFTIAGRKGWKRVLDRHGWKPTFTVLEIPIKQCYNKRKSEETAA